MSHEATHWLSEVSPADLTHGEFRVLFYLCDCHNPAMGCFPSQSYLIEHTGLSNGGLNNALSGLEKKRLIQRQRDHDERTKRRKRTRYMLGFEFENPQKPTPFSGDGANSTECESHLHSVRKPSPLSGVVYKDEPVNEPVREPVIGGGGSASESHDDVRVQNPDTDAEPEAPSMPARRFIREKLLEVMGFDDTGITPSGRIIGSGSDMIELNRWRDDLGLTDAEVLQVASDVCQYKRDGPPQSFRYFRSAMQRFAGEKAQPPLQKTIIPTTKTGTTKTGGSNETSHAHNPTRAEARMQAFLSGARRSS